MSPRDTSPPPAPDPLPAPAVDAHAHLEFTGVGIDTLIRDACTAGVTRMVTVGDSVPSSARCADTADTHPAVLASVAVHPNEVAGISEDDYAALDALARRGRVRAIGETGLDYYWGRVDPEVQREAFRRHIDLAVRHGLPVMIHDRDAHADVLAVLADTDTPVETVLHCFSGDARFAAQCLERGFVLSFAGTVTFRNAPELREAARLVPPEQLMVETDAPYLTPHPFRGRPNAPAMVAHTLRCLAEVRGEPVEAVCAATSATAERVYGSW